MKYWRDIVSAFWDRSGMKDLRADRGTNRELRSSNFLVLRGRGPIQ
jgi:hypothetical protein